MWILHNMENIYVNYQNEEKIISCGNFHSLLQLSVYGCMNELLIIVNSGYLMQNLNYKNKYSH